MRKLRIWDVSKGDIVGWNDRKYEVVSRKIKNDFFGKCLDLELINLKSNRKEYYGLYAEDWGFEVTFYNEQPS